MLYYYITSRGDNPIKKFLDSLSDKQQAKTLRLLSLLEKYGPIREMPFIKKLAGTPLWEIRILGKDNLRVLFARQKNTNILILHIFHKKKAKTEKPDLKVALERYKKQLTNDIS